jgi:hypothetical protein
LYLPRVIVRMENLMETEVLGEKLPRRHYVHHKSHLKLYLYSPIQLLVVVLIKNKENLP